MRIRNEIKNERKKHFALVCTAEKWFFKNLQAVRIEQNKRNKGEIGEDDGSHTYTQNA